FTERVRSWLAKTADGTLHPDDQSLEPLLFLPHGTLVVPHDLLANQIPLQPYSVFAVDSEERRSVWSVRKFEATAKEERKFIAVCFACPPQTHGVITVAPAGFREIRQSDASMSSNIVDEGYKIMADR